MKILIIRTDRIGDLILSIPVIRAIRSAYPDAFIGFIALETPGKLLKEHEDINSLYLLKPDYSNFKEILEEIKFQKYSHAITLMVDRKASWIPFLAGISCRIGPYSKILSFIKFNKGIIQKRSKSIKNEAEYNLELLDRISIYYKDLNIEDIKPFLEIKESHKLSFKNSFKKDIAESFGVIHPGMGGSALNLHKNSYLKVTHELSKKIPIYLTFGPNDNEIYKFFLNNYSKDFLINNLSIEELAFFYSKASFFIGPSTGPMHIAAAVQTKVFAIFSPIKVQSSTRWAPWGNKATIISPDVTCKGKFKCIKNCTFENCLLTLKPEKIIEPVMAFLENKNIGNRSN